MFSAWQAVEEECGAVIAELNVCIEGIACISGQVIDGFAGSCPEVFDQQIFIVIFAFDKQFDLEQVSAVDAGSCLQFFTAVVFGLRSGCLPFLVGQLDFFIVAVQAVNRSVNAHFESCLAQKILPADIFEIPIEIQRGAAGFAEFDFMAACGL